MLTVAALQYAPPARDPDLALQLALQALDRAADAGAELAVLPELANSGYLHPSGEALAEVAVSRDDTTGYLAGLAEWARQRNVGVVTGVAERCKEGVANAAVFLTPEGARHGYRKLHLFGRERAVFVRGEAAPEVVSWRGVRLAMAICFDWQFPELWRGLALQGADLVLHPSNLVIPDRCQRAVPVHAMLNRFYVVTANRIGREADLCFTGRSFIVDPHGQVLDEVAGEGEGLCVAAVDPSRARDKSVGEGNDLLADRRPDIYRGLF